MDLFNGTSVCMGDWKGLTDPTKRGIWKLNIVGDPNENNDL